MDPETKRCRTCNTAKPRSAFGSAFGKAGAMADCRPCAGRQRNAQRKAKQAADRAQAALVERLVAPPPAPTFADPGAVALPPAQNMQALFDLIAAPYAKDIFRIVLDLAVGRKPQLKEGEQPPDPKMLAIALERLLGRLNDRAPDTNEQIASLLRQLHTTQRRAGGPGRDADVAEPLSALETGGLSAESGAAPVSPGFEPSGAGSDLEAGSGGTASWEKLLRRNGIIE